MTTSLTAADDRTHFRAALLALERQQNLVGAEERAAAKGEQAEDLIRRVADDHRDSVFSALATGLETHLVTTSLTPEWFAERDRALGRIHQAVRSFHAVLRRVDRQAADQTATAINEAVRRAVEQAPPLATLELDDQSLRRPAGPAHAGGPRRKPGNTWTEQALREAGLTKEHARELLQAVGLRSTRRS